VSFIAGFMFASFFAVAAGLNYFRSRRESKDLIVPEEDGTGSSAELGWAGSATQAILDIGARRWAISAAIFFGISALLYTTFFTNMEGLCTAIWSPPIGSCAGHLGALQY